jgi:hypothetical protein
VRWNRFSKAPAWTIAGLRIGDARYVAILEKREEVPARLDR